MLTWQAQLRAKRKRGGAAPAWWAVDGRTCVGAWQAIGAASLAESLVNLSTPGTYDLTAGVAPTLGAAGWVCDGTRWLRTGITPPGTQDWTIICRFADGTGVTRAVMGGATNATAERCYLYPRRGAADTYLVANGGFLVLGVRLASGVLAVAGPRAYLDGVETANNIGAYTAAPPEMYLCGIKLVASPDALWIGTIQAAAAYSAALTAAEVAALSSRMAAL